MTTAARAAVAAIHCSASGVVFCNLPASHASQHEEAFRETLPSHHE